ncbi:MAG: cation transporter [Rhodospirillales bacterium]
MDITVKGMSCEGCAAAVKRAAEAAAPGAAVKVDLRAGRVSLAGKAERAAVAAAIERAGYAVAD